MKLLNFIYLTITVGSGILFAGATSAAQAHKVTSESRAMAAAPAASESSLRFGVGYSASRAFTGAFSSVTGLILLKDGKMIQGYLSVPSTSPVQFSFGGNFKHTISESQGAGFHLGGGLQLGSMASETKGGTGFFIGLDAIAGMHFQLAGSPHIQIHLDGGPCFAVTDGNSDFSIGALSALLGASIVYLF